MFHLIKSVLVDGEKHVQGICFHHISCPVCHKQVALVSSVFIVVAL